MAIGDILKDVGEFVIIAGLIILRVWAIAKAHERAEERRDPDVRTLFGKDQWWRRE
jgi:large-conductance mechanosensitive channel